MAASVAVLGFGLLLLKPMWQTSQLLPDGIIWRGEEQGQVIKVADFVARANQIESLLKQNDLIVRRVDNAKYVRLQAMVPAEAKALIEVLKNKVWMCLRTAD